MYKYNTCSLCLDYTYRTPDHLARHSLYIYSLFIYRAEADDQRKDEGEDEDGLQLRGHVYEDIEDWSSLPASGKSQNYHLSTYEMIFLSLFSSWTK
jgi:hypothetical protein